MKVTQVFAHGPAPCSKLWCPAREVNGQRASSRSTDQHPDEWSTIDGHAKMTVGPRPHNFVSHLDGHARGRGDVNESIIDNIGMIQCLPNAVPMLLITDVISLHVLLNVLVQQSVGYCNSCNRSNWSKLSWLESSTILLVVRHTCMCCNRVISNIQLPWLVPCDLLTILKHHGNILCIVESPLSSSR